MNYWITTQFPPLEVDEIEAHSGIYLPDDRVEAGRNIQPGDMVLIYESKTGRTIVKKYLDGTKEYFKSIIGKQGIVSIARVTSRLLRDDNSEATHYTDGSKIWWLWYATTSPVSNNGFVHRTEVNKVLSYKELNPMRGFGDKQSGVKKITKEQFDNLVELFNRKTRNIADVKKKLNGRRGGSGGGGESDSHKFLKLYIASNPSKVLSEENLNHLETEYKFPTQDRADLILIDGYGKLIGLEVEVSVEPFQFEGIIQAVKYRYMLAVLLEYPFEHSRSFLVAYNIADEIKELCNKYDVECFTVPKAAVEAWARENGKMS